MQICFPSRNQETTNQQWGEKLSQILRSFHGNRNERSHREFSIQNTTFCQVLTKHIKHIKESCYVYTTIYIVAAI